MGESPKHQQNGTAQSGLERDRQMPSKIEARSLNSKWFTAWNVDAMSFGMSSAEGIKPLMLYKLYNGPWRLDL